MIKSIKLNPDKYTTFQFSKGDYFLSDLNKINIFLGPNNVGKSRFMRKLFSEEDSEIILHNHNFDDIQSYIKKRLSSVEQYFDKYEINEASDIKLRLRTLSNLPSYTNLPGLSQHIEKFREYAEYFLTVKLGGSVSWKNHSSAAPFEELNDLVKEIGRDLIQLLARYFPDEFRYKPTPIYIPTLRGLRPLRFRPHLKDKEEGVDYYLDRTVFDYFGNNQNAYRDKVFTGLTLYEDIKRLLLGNKAGRSRVRQFEDFLSVTFFEKQPVSLIPNIDKDVLLITIGSQERDIFDYGDGIQALIILLYPLFLYGNKNLILFVEEPEAALHPGYQRLYLETIMKPEFSHVQFFFTTHSNHFLDITLDMSQISLFSFNNITDKNELSTVIDSVSNANNKLLDLLGVRNSSVFLSNCTIWVEGITDRLYLKQYFSIFQEHLLANKIDTPVFLEDLHFSFVEYSGSNLAHWSFTDEAAVDQIKAFAISNRIMIIADQDKLHSDPDNKKSRRLLALKKVLGDRVQILPGREIENLIHPTVLLKTIRHLQPKGSNIQINDDSLSPSVYLNEPLGRYIDKAIPHLARKFSDHYLTIRDKVNFCKTAIDFTITMDDLTDEVKTLISTIRNFVSASNAT